MLGLPKQTEIKKIIPKNAIFAKFSMNTAAKDKFNADIKQITLVSELSKNTLTISEGDNVKSVYAMLVSLKKQDFDENNIIILSKLIPQKMVFLIEYNDRYKIAIYHTKLMQTEWLPQDRAVIKLQGLNLDAIWENFIVQIGKITVAEGNTLNEQIAADEKRRKLAAEIERLEKKAYKEKQPRRKLELAGQIKKLKQELELIGSENKLNGGN